MKTYRSLKMALLTGLTLTFGASSATAQNAMIGVLNLYEGEAISLDAAQISELGCTIHRHGMIGGAQGDIDLEQPNQFLLLACDASVLEDTARRADFAAVTGSSIEGSTRPTGSLKPYCYSYHRNIDPGKTTSAGPNNGFY